MRNPSKFGVDVVLQFSVFQVDFLFRGSNALNVAINHHSNECEEGESSDSGRGCEDSQDSEFAVLSPSSSLLPDVRDRNCSSGSTGQGLSSGGDVLGREGQLLGGFCVPLVVLDAGWEPEVEL